MVCSVYVLRRPLNRKDNEFTVITTILQTAITVNEEVCLGSMEEEKTWNLLLVPILWKVFKQDIKKQDDKS